MLRRSIHPRGSRGNEAHFNFGFSVRASSRRLQRNHWRRGVIIRRLVLAVARRNRERPGRTRGVPPAIVPAALPTRAPPSPVLARVAWTAGSWRRTGRRGVRIALNRGGLGMTRRCLETAWQANPFPAGWAGMLAGNRPDSGRNPCSARSVSVPRFSTSLCALCALSWPIFWPPQRGSALSARPSRSPSVFIRVHLWLPASTNLAIPAPLR